MTFSNEVFFKVADRLSKMGKPKNRKLPITADTEVYFDLNIYGDDLFDLFLWIEKEFGVKNAWVLSDYAPGERSFPWISRVWKKRRKVNESLYKSLTVRSIVDVIAARDSD